MIGIQDTSRLTRLAVHLVAAKQDIVNIGFPEIIAKLLYERYGKLAPLIAKWYKGYSGAPYADRPDWWSRINSFSNRGISVQSLVRLYEEGVDPESFRQVCDHENINLNSYPHNQGQVDESRQELVPEIRATFFKEIFFNYSAMMQAINSGKLTDLAAYKKLKFMDAEVKYDERRHFEEAAPLKVYENGFKWIDTGKKSALLARQMSNCGSAGVMSLDEDRTILTLFGPTNKPHVMVTYSPKEKRISGDECAGSTPVKPEYHSYVLDLAHHLGAQFDEERSKSPELRVKYLLRDKAQSVERIDKDKEFAWHHYFRFVMDGQEFYTDGDLVVSGTDMKKVQGMVKRRELKFKVPQDEIFESVMIDANRHQMEDLGIKFTKLRKFVGEQEIARYF